jgi:hypothetical protein
VVQDWTASNTYRWTPTTANPAYRVGVWVRNATSTADAYDNDASNGSVGYEITGPVAPSVILLTGLAADRVAPQPVGTAITWTATATGSTGSYHYKWWLYDGSQWTVLREWAASNTYTWVPTSPNPSYKVGVWVRKATSTADAYDGPSSNGSVAFPIRAVAAPGQLVLSSLTPDRASPQSVGTGITWTAVAEGGSGSYQYKWWLYDGSRWTVLRDWTGASTYIWTPTTVSAAYRIGVWVREAASTADAYDNPLSNGSVGFTVR